MGIEDAQYIHSTWFIVDSLKKEDEKLRRAEERKIRLRNVITGNG